MIITIFGATGTVGKELVKQALFGGHTVRAFGRNVFTAGWQEDKNLQLVKGALFDELQVRHAVSGADVVLSALGGSFDGTDKARSLGLKNIITQMQATGCKRIIAVGGKGQLDMPDGSLLMEDKAFPQEYLPVSEEHLKALRFLEHSGLDWTFICSPDIVPGSATGHFHTARNVAPEPDNNGIFAGDLALFMLKEMTNGQYIASKVGISN